MGNKGLSCAFPKQVAILLSEHHPIALGVTAGQCSYGTNLAPQDCLHLSMENRDQMWLKGESTRQVSQTPLLLLAPLVSKLHRQSPFPEKGMTADPYFPGTL